MTRHRKPGKHKPVHPGEVLWEEFIYPSGMSCNDVEEQVGLPSTCLVYICWDRAPITPQIAEGLAKAFGNSEQFWLGLQAQYDAEMEAR
jgi:addiction module HigA family antidote